MIQTADVMLISDYPPSMLSRVFAESSDRGSRTPSVRHVQETENQSLKVLRIFLGTALTS